MGKETRKHKGVLRKGPFPNRKPTSNLNQPANLNINAIKQQLQVPNFEEKLCALQTIGTYLESEEFVKLLVDNGIVRIIFPFLIDENLEVRNMTAGILRNFSTLSLDACEYLIEQDVMTILITFIKKHIESWIPKQVQGQSNTDKDTFLHGIHLLWNLCESSGVSIKYVNDSHILPFLVKCIDRKIYGDDLVIAIVHCLFVIIEDNPSAIVEIKDLCEAPLNQLLSTENKNSNDLLLKTLASGIILNIKYPIISSVPKDFLQCVMQTLNHTLTIDIRSSCHKISSVLPLQSSSDSSNHNTDAHKNLQDVKNLIDSQQIAIEIITNLCSPEDKDDTMDIDDSSDVDSDMEDEGCAPNGTTPEALYEVNKVPAVILEQIVQFDIVKKVWEKTAVLAENVIQILNDTEEGKLLYHRYCNLQSRALLCMNNFIENMPIENLGGYKDLYTLWIETGKLVFKQMDDKIKNDEVLESSTAVMRAALDRLKSSAMQPSETCVVVDLFKGISSTDLHNVLNGISHCDHPEIRLNLTRMLGNLALILSTRSSANPSETEILIVNFLTDRIFKESECWTLAELLDTVMDMFAEDDTDRLAQQVNLIEKLNEISPVIKNKIRQQKKTLGDHMAVVSTVAANLPRFIKYKKRRIDLLNKSN